MDPSLINVDIVWQKDLNNDHEMDDHLSIIEIVALNGSHTVYGTDIGLLIYS